MDMSGSMETKPSTLEALRAAALALVEKETERDPVPAAIEKMCAERAGKPLTKRDVAALESMFPGLHASIVKSQHGSDVRLRYWTSVSVDYANKFTHRRGEETAVYGSGWTGERDASGEPIRSEELAAAQVALYRSGVPTSQDAYGILVRGYHTSAGGPVRWPTVEELREMNKSAYGARDERNAKREKNADAIKNTDDAQLVTIARLVDELNLIAADLRTYVDDEGTPSEFARVVRDMLTVDLAKKEGR